MAAVKISTLTEERWLSCVSHDTPDAQEARRLFCAAFREKVGLGPDIRWNCPGNSVAFVADESVSAEELEAAYNAGVGAVREMTDRMYDEQNPSTT